MGTQTITAEDNLDAPGEPLIALLFAEGERPSAADIGHVAAVSGEFAAVFEGPADEGWVEALVTGLSFDIVGLTPAEPVPTPQIAHRLGLEASFAADRFEAIAIRPGPHLAGGVRGRRHGLDKAPGLVSTSPGRDRPDG